MSELLFRAAGPADIPLLGSLSSRIWRTSYGDLLLSAQIDHMLAWMYAPDAIAAEMARGVLWHVAERGGDAVGYHSLSIEGGTAELHKLYLAPELQGRGFGQEMLAHAQALARRGGAATMRLRVNRNNERALRSYGRAGFVKVDEVVSDIGAGFVMDDFVLALRLDLPTSRLVKICGLSTADTMAATLAAGADQVGLVFFSPSPRDVTLAQAQALAAQARGQAEIVALTVDADDALLDAIVTTVQPDWLQLHGRESPARAAAVRGGFGRRVMKALGVADRSDHLEASAYADAVDRILFDAKPSAHATLPGGNGQAFDWTILRDAPPGFMLSGGLSPLNVAEAIAVSGATAVDVSSGVESAPGRKDAAKIADFVRAAKGVGRDLAATRG